LYAILTLPMCSTCPVHLILSDCATFRNMLCFYCGELLAPRPTPKPEDHPLSSVRECSFKIFAAPYLETVSSIRNPRAECPQCYCGEIRQMLTFLINLYCPKTYHRPDHSIRIDKYHRK
jgi:hypothetical protein